MFKSSRGALLFVAITMLSTFFLVGSEEDEGALLKAAADIEEQQGRMEAGQDAAPGNSAPIGFAPEDADDAEFTAEEELVDGAHGIDPTPEIEAPLVSAEPEVSLVESHAEIIHH